MRKVKLFSVLMCLFIGIGQMWGDTATETISMKGFAGLTSSGYQNVTVSGTSAENSIGMVAYAFNPSTGQVRGGKTAVAGASVTTADANKNWSLYNSAAMPGAITAIKVTQTATGTNKFQNNLYVSLGTSTQGNVTVITSAQQQDAGGTATEINFTIDGTKNYTFFKLLSTEKFTAGTVADVVVKVTYETSGGGGGGDEPEDPSLSVSPTSWDFEDVASSDEASKEFSVSGSNLTAGTLTISVPEGFSVSPSSISVTEATLAATAVTVSKNTTDINDYSGNLSFSGCGLAEAKTVALEMSVVADPEPTGTFALFSGALTEGDYVLVGYSTSAQKYYAMNNTVTDNQYLGITETSISNNQIENPNGSLVWTIAESSNGYYIKNGNEYLDDNATSNKNYAHLVAEPATTSEWNFAYQQEPETWTITNYGTTTTKKTLSFNIGNSRVACYTGIQSGNTCVYLYKKALPTHAVTFTAAPTGGTVAVSAGSAISSGDQVEEGATVTITPAPSQYYRLVSVTKGGQAIEPVQGVYSFTMPTSDVAIAVTFEYIPVTQVTVTPASLTLVVGESSSSLSATVLPNNALGTVTWSSANSNIASVNSETGVVTAVAASENPVNIIATSTVTGTVSGTCAVTVNAPTGNPISISQVTGGTVTANVDVSDVLEGTSVTLTATPADGYSVSGWTIVGVEEEDLTISQDKTTCSFAMPDDEVLAEASFTHEVAVLKLHDANGESTYDGENTHYWKEQVTLPNTAAACSKTFVGWSAESNHSSAPELGATYVLPNKGVNDIYAVYADAEGGNTDVEFNAGTYASANNWLNGTAYTEFTISDVNFKANGGGNNGKYYTSDKSWRMYNGGSIAITASANIVSVTSTPSKDFTINGTSASLSLSATTQFTSITVTVVGETTYSNYSTTCQQQAAAPTFSVEAGTYYVAQNNIVLASTTENATIYYTTDGSDPKTSGTKQTYSAAISLSERAITTIKAYAVAEGYESSAVAEATYNINLPYSFAEFAALTPKENGKEYVVRGIISQKDAFNTQYNEIPYYISANGSTEGQIKCHNGLGLNKATFTSADDINLGDNVTVVGTWSTSFSNLGAGNWMLEYTARVPAEPTYEIVGNLTTSNFDEGEAFDAGILANLTVNALFTNGYKEEVDGVTFTYGEKATWEAGDEKLTVTAVKNEGNLVSRDFDVTVTSATLESIELKADDGEYQTKKVYYVGEDFVAPTIVATLSDETTIEAVATLVSGFDNENAGVQEVTVSYTRGDVTKTTSYNITMKAIFNNEDDPHTVAVANALIVASEYQNKTSSTDYMWVRGKVVGFNGTSNNNYYISDNGTAEGQLYVYGGKYFNGATMNATNKPAVGDSVVLKATILNYQGNTAELTNSWVVYQIREGALSIEDVTGFEVGSADLNVTVTTASNGDITFVSGDEEVVTIVDGNLHAVAAGTATITANLAATANEGAINYTAASTTFSVTVIAALPRYTVTFANGGATGGTAPEAIDDQLENTEVTLPACTWTWEGHKFTGWAVTYGENVPVEVENNQFNMPAANVTLTAQWAEVATAKISFMVGGVKKASIDKEQEVAFTIAQDGSAWAPTGFTFVGWATTEQAEETEVAPTTITEYTPQAGVAEVSLYGIYSRVEGEGETNHYVLDYAADGIGEMTLGYGNAVNVTATDGSQWVVKAFKSQGMQLNSGANSSIKIPNCSGNIVSIAVTGNASKAIGFSESDYSGSGTITYVVQGTDATSQNLSFAGKTVKAGYIVPVSKANQITHIDVAYDAAKTYYTSSPVEKVTITFDANGGEGGCQKAIINKGAEFTICENVPTKSHSEFAGWKLNETTTIYQANQNIGEVEEDITLTAQWEDAATYDVTYNVNGSSDAAPTQEAQYAGDQFEVGAAVTKEGFTFQGWKYGSKLYKAGASFTMPAEAVTFVAQWRKASVPVDKMSMVTSASALSNGMPIALGCSYGENSFAMAGDFTGSNKYMTSVTDGVSLSDGVATYTDAVVVMTLEQDENGWKITKDGTNYLNETSVKNLAWTTKENATIWSISFSGNNVKISSANGTMKFNAQDPRFTTYASGQKDIQLFGKAVVVTEDASISDLGYTEGEAIVASGANVTLTIDEPTTVPSITAKDGATVVIDEQTTAESVVVEDGSKIVANAETTTPTVYFSTSMGSTQVPGSASELGSVEKITLATGGEIIYDLTLGTSMAGIQADPNQWHAFTLPFAVSATEGIYDAETGEKLYNEVNYAIMDYHGDIRANGDYGWKKYRGILQPGVFYLMTVDGNTKTFRFKAAKTGAMTQTTSMGYKAYNGSGDSSKDFGWNGIGNPSWVSGTVIVNVQVLDPYSYTYQPLTSGTNLTVSTPFFYNAGGDGTTGSVVMQDAGAGANYAPRRAPANEIEKVAVSFGNEVFRDKIYISASEDALNTYEQDKDLVRMIMSNTPKVAQIFGNAYGMKLSMVNAPMVNDQATYGLTLYAPNAGAYTIAVPEMENADIYLTLNGAIIWNLSMGDYTNDFAKGNNEGYGLLLVKKAPQVTTGVENAEANETGVQKVIINEHVYILRAEQMYDVTGKLVK